jgi:outer membrane protein TolC
MMWAVVAVGMGVGDSLSSSLSLSLREEEYRAWVATQHPVAEAAALYTDEAAEWVRRARGGFDPVATATAYDKAFGGTTYYRVPTAGLAVPLPGPLDAVVGYGTAEGERLNPERYAPDGGVARAGVSMRLGAGLVTDARRTALRQAEVYVGLNEAKRMEAMNGLMWGSAQAFWRWYRAERVAAVAGEAEGLAAARLVAVREAWVQGDRAAIDTVEAWGALERRRAERGAALAAAAETRGAAGAFVAGAGEVELGGVPAFEPAAWEEARRRAAAWDGAALEAAWEVLPAREALEAEQDVAELELRLRREALKPVVNAEWSYLQGVEDQGSAVSVVASMPLFLRKERAQVRLGAIATERLVLEQEALGMQWRAAVEAEARALSDRARTLNAARAAAAAAKTLLEAETTRFNAGESSVFLLIARETAWLEAERTAADAEADAMLAARRLDFRTYRWE